MQPSLASVWRECIVPGGGPGMFETVYSSYRILTLAENRFSPVVWWGLMLADFCDRHPFVITAPFHFLSGIIGSSPFSTPLYLFGGRRLFLANGLWRKVMCALLDLAPIHLANCPLLSSLSLPAPPLLSPRITVEWIQRSLSSKSLLRDVSRTAYPETSTSNYGLQQLNLYWVKALRFYGSLFLPI